MEQIAQTVGALAYSVVVQVIVAVAAPIGWLGHLWQGQVNRPMNQQLPAFGSWTHFGPAAIALLIIALGALVYGRARNRLHLTTRVAMVTVGLATYVALLATSLPYLVTRSTFSAIALSLIFSSRLIKRLRPIKTVLFFIGVGFTCEAVAWSLANATATVTAFGILSLTAAFFTRIDKKRALKTSCISFAAFLIFLFAVVQSVGVPLDGIVAVISVSLAFLALFVGARLLRAISYSYKCLQAQRMADDVRTGRRPSVLSRLRIGSMKDHAQVFETTPDGLTELTYPHIEVLGRGGSRIVYHAPELKVVKNSASGLVMFKIASIFGDTNSVLIGCGNPNMATSVYDETAGTWKRMSAFMLYREPSKVTELDELQAGVYFELRGLNAETRQLLIKAMYAHSGKRAPSCAYLNARVLVAAGFSLGDGHDLTKVVRPSRLAKLIWKYGLEHDGSPVTIRVVNTSALDVSDHFIGVWRKEVNSPIRLIHKAFKRKATSAHSEAVPDAVVALRASESWSGRPVTVWMNRPNLVGVALTRLWGRHAEFRVAVPGLKQSPNLLTPLESFPGPLNWLSKAKKHVLFSKPVVSGINRIKNKSFDRYDNVPVDAALEMMSPVTAESGERVLWNFALILSDDTYEIRLSPLKNLDPLSQASKFRQISNWILAKHVVATGYDPHTVYAGEAWVIRSRQDSLVTLGLNDNSGTYQPTAEQLEAVAKLFASLGIEVRTFPRANRSAA